MRHVRRQAPAAKRVVIALSEYALNQSGCVEGVAQYTLTHSNLAVHMHIGLTDPDDDVRLLRQVMLRLRPHGLLACFFQPIDGLLLPARTHVVNVGDYWWPDLPTVMSDQAEAGRIVAKHFLEQGITCHAFVAIMGAGAYGAECRWQGFHQCLQESGHDATRYENPAPHMTSNTDASLVEWVRNLPKPVGIHTYTLVDARRIAWACREAGLRIPGDVALVGGQDNSALAAAWSPAISTIEFDLAKVGYEGLRLLDSLIQGGPAPATMILVPPRRLLARASSDVRGSQDAEIARIRQWMRENIHSPMSVKTLLEQTHLSRRTLERRYSALAGHTAHEEICRLRIERAQALLRGTSLSIEQVATQSGYSGYMTFALAFRRATGMTASAFRRRTSIQAVTTPVEKNDNVFPTAHCHSPSLPR